MTIEEALGACSLVLVLVDVAGQNFRTADGKWWHWSDITADTPLSDLKFFHSDSTAQRYMNTQRDAYDAHMHTVNLRVLVNLVKDR